MPITITLDLEDHRAGAESVPRYLDNTVRILDFFAAQKIRATIFVVGDIIEDCAALLRRAAAEGHELALHSATHTPLTELTHALLLPALRDARRRLEDVIGDSVRGFRAPVFSLTATTAWATEVLAELDFTYSSSVLPAASPLFGYPGAPVATFRWRAGIIEFPVPLARVGPLTLPFLGGIYLRYLPLAFITARAGRLAPAVPQWAYLHPYDIDDQDTFFRFPGTTLAQSVLLWRRRRHTLSRLATLLERTGGQAGRPFAEQCDALDAASLPTWP